MLLMGFFYFIVPYTLKIINKKKTTELIFFFFIFCFLLIMDLFVHEKNNGKWLYNLLYNVVNFNIFFYCCAGWGYIVGFSKVFIVCQIYHTEIHPFHHSLLPPPQHSWNSFNRYHFFIYIHVCTVFALYSPSHSLSPPPPLSH
jgi:hypothetical protein